MTTSKKLILTLAFLCFSQGISAQDIGLTKQFSSCMDQSNGVTINMLDCIGAETKRQDLRLNKAYRNIINELSAERKKQLLTAQRAWISYRDANCQFYADPEGGSLARVSASDCLMSMTASRSKELEVMAGQEAPAAAPSAAPPAPQPQGAAPAPTKPIAKPTAQSLTGPQKNAVRAAQSYLSISAFSRDGLIEQLSSPAGNGFDKTDATKAVDSMTIDWNQQAVKSAKEYLKLMGFSCAGLIQQLSSQAGSKFTESQARFGAKQAGAC